MVYQHKENLCYSVDSAFSFLPYDLLTPWQHPPSLSITANLVNLLRSWR